MDYMNELDRKILDLFYGYVVKKGLSSSIKNITNVPLFVLEYLLGKYCSSSDQEDIEQGIEKVQSILSTNYVTKSEENLIKSRIKELGSYVLIDKISARLDEKRDSYAACLSNLDIGEFYLPPEYILEHEKILVGGVWSILKIGYSPGGIRKELDGASPLGKRKYDQLLDTPFLIKKIQTIQMSNIDINEIVDNRSQFSLDEWINLIIRSVGYEPDNFSDIARWHTIERLVPLAEKNYNLVELGPRSTGKSYIYKEVSPYSILMSGGLTTTASLFYNMANRRLGLVGAWDCITFDEVTGIRSRGNDTIQTMKDYMTSGSFARGQESLVGEASMVFIGNIDDTPEQILKVSHLFLPFPSEFNNDSAFFDRIHYYIPGWEFPKLKKIHFTDRFGFISDFLAEFLKKSRDTNRAPDIYDYFDLNNNVNKRDEIAIHKTVSGLLKILFPDRSQTKAELESILRYAITGRRRVKEQLEKMQGSEFYDVDLGYIDRSTGEEYIVYTSEQAKTTLLIGSPMKPGHVYGIGYGLGTDHVGIFKLENRLIVGEGKFRFEKVRSKSGKESLQAAWAMFVDHASLFVRDLDISKKDFLTSFTDTQKNGESADVSVAELVGLFSATLDCPIIPSLVVCGSFNLAGTMQPPPPLEEVLRLTKNSGANKLLIHEDALDGYETVSDYYKVGIELMVYEKPVDAIQLALGDIQ